MKTGPREQVDVGKWEEEAAAGRSWYSPRIRDGDRKGGREGGMGCGDIHTDQGFKFEEPGRWQSHHLWQF